MLVPEIVPTILAATEEDYEKKLRLVENLVVRVQVDVIDGEFAPGTTIGAATVEKFGTAVSRDIHLMVADPIAHIGEFSRIGVDHIIFHAEVCENLERVIEEIKSLGNRVGIALNVETPVAVIDRVIEAVDLVQLLAVEPGFVDQRFNPLVLPKILSLREKYPSLVISVDGGVLPDNAKELVDAGATQLILATPLFAAANIGDYLQEIETAVLAEEQKLEGVPSQ